jgi:hypothetical protein
MQNELDLVTNRDLFSNYYLQEHLLETDDRGVDDADEWRHTAKAKTLQFVEEDGQDVDDARRYESTEEHEARDDDVIRRHG